MDLLFRILYAQHASGPHHKLALDALTKLAGPSAEAWRRLFLANAEGYMTGAKAPDTTFKDFKNHVLHVQENNWGGAPAKSREWYGTLVSHLSAQRWAEAVYAAGVLSHYVVDPVMPFHTGQSDAENTIHRAAEWSISRSYDALKAEAATQAPLPAPVAGQGASWLEDLVIAGANTSNPFYWDLIRHYDFAAGVADPPTGLDQRARAIAAGLLAYASSEFALVLDRAFAEARVQPPAVNLSLATIVATLKVPLKWITKKLDDAADRRAVEAMYAELLATGKVDETLSEQEKTIRALHAKEVLGPRTGGAAPEAKPVPAIASASGDPMARFFSWCSEQSIAKAKAEARAALPVTLFARPAAGVSVPQTHAAALAPVLPAAPRTVPEAPRVAALARSAPEPVAVTAPTPVRVVPLPARAEASPAAAALLPAATATNEPHPVRVDSPRAAAPLVSAAGAAAHRDAHDRAERTYLALEDDVERAPSIGPKTADRLKAVGVATVADLLVADPARVAAALDVRHIRSATLVDWQDQSRLVLGVPGLRGTHAQLLVGAGYRTPASLAEAEPDVLCARVLAFAASTAGQHVLRDGHPPDMERIVGWRTSAARAKAA